MNKVLVLHPVSHLCTLLSIPPEQALVEVHIYIIKLLLVFAQDCALHILVHPNLVRSVHYPLSPGIGSVSFIIHVFL